MLMNFLFALAVLLLIYASLSYMQLFHDTRYTGVFRDYPVPRARLDEIDDIFQPDQFGPTLQTEVRFVGRAGSDVMGGTLDSEAWILAVLAKQAKNMFEFGTCTGKTTYLWAVNSGPDSRITTLTLPPEDAQKQVVQRRDNKGAARSAACESCFREFMYLKTPVEPKITQLYLDSKSLDESLYLGRFDLIFVDGSHTYSYVKSDTEKALKMLSPGGYLVWHDYSGPYSGSKDVYRYLNELVKKLPLKHIEGTSLVVYKRAG